MAAIPGGTEWARKALAGVCPVCNKKVQPNTFRDVKSVRDYRITGLCQGCQDTIYTEEDDSEIQ
jgi:hypothetical protein